MLDLLTQPLFQLLIEKTLSSGILLENLKKEVTYQRNQPVYDEKLQRILKMISQVR